MEQYFDMPSVLYQKVVHIFLHLPGEEVLRICAQVMGFIMTMNSTNRAMQTAK